MVLQYSQVNEKIMIVLIADQRVQKFLSRQIIC